jgi:hypothetical protein
MLALTLQSFPRLEIVPSGTGTASLTAAAPCDIYASGGTPCLAAMMLLAPYTILTMVRSTKPHAAQMIPQRTRTSEGWTCRTRCSTR